MKRAEIKAGAVYGIERFGDPNPVVFLEDAGATIWQRNPYSRTAFEPARTGERPGKDGIYGSRGYAVIRPADGLDGKWDEALAALEAVDPAAEMARFRVQPRRDAEYQPGGGLLTFDVITSLSKVAGLYDEAIAARRADRDAADRRIVRDREVAAEQHNRGAAAVAGLADLGIKAQSWPDVGRYTVRLDLVEAEKLLGMLKRARMGLDPEG